MSSDCFHISKDWLVKIQDEETKEIKAKCNLCNSEFSVKQKEIGHLKNHMETAKHIQMGKLKAKN